jgi:hypothetical protein
MRIAFHIPIVDVRGTSVAAYDYAHYNETLLYNESIIISPIDVLHKCDEIALKRFSDRFEMRFYADVQDLELTIYDCEVLYVIKYGKQDGIESKRVKTVVHCVFDMTDPHGDVYAGVSSTLAQKFGRDLYVPHMIGLKPDLSGQNMRQDLGIPEEARVFGRYGGMDTFDLQFAREVIQQVAHEYPTDIFFLFANTPVFCSEPNVIHLNKIVDDDEKNRFINTCDAHLECGSLGHTFGLAMGEFSVNNKPIIAYMGHVWNTAHYEILGNKAIYFGNVDEFHNILTSFSPNGWRKRDNNAYRDYSPENVMKIFTNVFLS